MSHGFSVTQHENITHHSLPLPAHLLEQVRECHPPMAVTVSCAMFLEGKDTQILENTSDVASVYLSLNENDSLNYCSLIGRLHAW
jgi:hypothetical protein